MNQLRLSLAAGAAMAAFAFAAPAPANPDPETTNQEVREIKIVKADGKKVTKTELAGDCGKGRKFESTGEAGDEQNKTVSKMVICSDPGESDEAWAKTLRDALARVRGDDELPDEGKARIMADLQSEIAKLGK